MFSLWLYLFIAVFILLKFVLVFFFDSVISPRVILEFTPLYLTDAGEVQLLFVSLIIVLVNAYFHLVNRKKSLILSFIPTTVMISGIALAIAPAPFSAENSLYYVLFGLMLISVIADHRRIITDDFPSAIERRVETEIYNYPIYGAGWQAQHLETKKDLARTEEARRTFSTKHILTVDNNWERYKAENKNELEPEKIRAVQKMLACGDPKKLLKVYTCKNCGIIQSSSCNSVLCSDCRDKAIQLRAYKLGVVLLNVDHMHLIFRPPTNLGDMFEDKWGVLDILMTAAIRAIKDEIHSQSKSESVPSTAKRNKAKKRSLKPGIVCVLSLYENDLQFNPQIHAFVTKGGFDYKDKWTPIDTINTATIAKNWQSNVEEDIEGYRGNELDFQEKIIIGMSLDDFKISKEETIKKKQINSMIMGISALSTPAYKIVDYDGLNVTLFSNNEKITIYEKREYIKQLVKSIPKQDFNMIRYYGIYPPTKMLAPPGSMKKASLIQEKKLKYFVDKHEEMKKAKCEVCGEDVKFIAMVREY